MRCGEQGREIDAARGGPCAKAAASAAAAARWRASARSRRALARSGLAALAGLESLIHTYADTSPLLDTPLYALTTHHSTVRRASLLHILPTAALCVLG